MQKLPFSARRVVHSNPSVRAAMPVARGSVVCREIADGMRLTALLRYDESWIEKARHRGASLCSELFRVTLHLTGDAVLCLATFRRAIPYSGEAEMAS